MAAMAACDDSLVASWEALPADAARSVVELLDAPSLARLRCTSSNGRLLVDTIAADLHARHLRECRQRVARRSTVVARGGSDGVSSFVADVRPTQPLRLWGGMCCGGQDCRRSLHRHSVLGGSGGWVAASYCGRQALLSPSLARPIHSRVGENTSAFFYILQDLAP